MNFEIEEEMRKKLIEDASEQGMHLINIGIGTFDLILDSKLPRIIELL